MNSLPLNTRRLRALATAAFCALTVASCDSSPFGEANCLSIAYSGVTVSVPGGSALIRLGKAISGTIIDGAYTEELKVSANPAGDGPAGLYGAVERAGNYSLVVRVTGYQDFRVDNIRVEKTRDGCHVKPVDITANLTSALMRANGAE